MPNKEEKNIKIRKPKIKLNIDMSYVKRLIFAIGFFILIDSIFLFISIGNNSDEIVNHMVKEGYSKTKAKLLTSLSSFGIYFTDWFIFIVFLISIMLGRNKMEMGNLFNYGWMVFLLGIALLPFANPAISTILIIKSGLVLIPIFFIIWILYQQTNDLRWLRKAHIKKIKGGMYV